MKNENLFIICTLLYATYIPICAILIYHYKKKNIDIGNPVIVFFTVVPVINLLYLVFLIITGKYYGMNKIPKLLKELWK